MHRELRTLAAQISTEDDLFDLPGRDDHCDATRNTSQAQRPI